jgi:hypothetical protein
MLDLDSDRWRELSAAGGHPELVPRLIRSLAERPTEAAWGEVWEQVGHQWSLYSSAYAALAHLLGLGISQGIATTPDFLLCVGRVAARMEAPEPCPDDLKAAFDAAVQEARELALQAARDPAYDPRDYLCVL